MTERLSDERLQQIAYRDRPTPASPLPMPKAPEVHAMARELIALRREAAELRKSLQDCVVWCVETSKITDPDSSNDFNAGWREGLSEAGRKMRAIVARSNKPSHAAPVMPETPPASVLDALWE